MSKIQCTIFVLILFAIACKTNKQNQILSINEMKMVTADIIRVDEYVLNIENKDSANLLKNKLQYHYEMVYKIHNTNKEQFINSYKFYEKKPELLKALFDSVSVTMQRKTKTYGGAATPKI